MSLALKTVVAAMAVALCAQLATPATASLSVVTLQAGASAATPSPTPSTSPAPPVPSTPPAPPAPRTVDCAKVKCVALTFDDGPVKSTAHVLDALAARKAHATFFVLGSLAKKQPALLRRMIAEGHAVGNHSWNHPILSTKSSKTIRSQFVRTQKVLDGIIGKRPMLVRTPFGQQDKRIRKILGSLGSPVILWNVDPQDWKDRNTKVVVHRVLKAARRNSIILIHDVWPTTRAAVPAIIAGLQAKGYVLVTVPELVGSRPKPGKVYLHR